MKKILIILSAITIACVSCEKPQGSFWGETEYFEKWLFRDYEPVKMERTLYFDFNQDARDCLETITLEVVQKTPDNAYIVPDDIYLYKNGEECHDNSFSVSTAERKADITIVFKNNAAEGNHNFFIREKGSNLDELDSALSIGGVGFTATKKVIKNPLLRKVQWAGNIIVFVLVVWLLVVYCFVKKFDRVKIQKIFVTVDGSRRNIMNMNPSVVGSKEVILTSNAKKKQGWIAALFIGKVTYITISSIPCDVTLTPGNGKYQTKASCSMTHFYTSIAGDRRELKVLTSRTGNVEIEFYSNRQLQKN